MRGEIVHNHHLARVQGGREPCVTQAKSISPFMGPSKSFLVDKSWEVRLVVDPIYAEGLRAQ